MKNTRKFLAVFLIGLIALFPVTNILNVKADNSMLKIVSIFQTSSYSDLGIDSENVRIGWKLGSDIRGAKQTAYSVIVSDKSGEVWKSGWVNSGVQAGIKLKNLSPEKVYSYKVQVKDQNGTVSGFSDEASFETAPAVLSGNWLGGGQRIIRKKFALTQSKENIERARAFVGSTTIVEARVNGKKAGDIVLAPTKPVPDVSAYYNTYDILPLLLENDNTLGLMFGLDIVKDQPNMYPMGDKVKAMYKIYYKDGSVQTIGTDTTWTGNETSPVTWADFMAGENHDVTIMSGWDTNTFTEDGTWKPAKPDGLETIDGSLNLISSTGLFFSKQSFSGNYTIEVKATVKENALGIVFGSGSPNGALWQLQVAEDNILKTHMPGLWNVVNRVTDANIIYNSPITLKIEINGLEVKTYINGTLKDTAQLSAGQTSGPIGIRSDLNEASAIDYIKVTRGADTVFEDNFDGIDVSKWNYPNEIEMEPAITAAKEIEYIKPVSINEIGGKYVVDFGKNMSGYVKIKSGALNSSFTVKYAELLNADGTINPISEFHGQHNIFKTGGTPCEFVPKFFYTGFQFVEVSDYGKALTKDDITACFVSEALEKTGEFSSSNQRLNDSYGLYVQSQLSNIVNLYTDCPQREKDGWTGDASVVKESAAILLNDYTAAENFIRNSMKNIFSNGQPFVRVPKPLSSPQGFGEWGYIDPPWTSAYFVFPFETYMQTGDTYYIEIAYDGLMNIFNFYKTWATDYIISKNMFGDWVGNCETDRAFISTAYVYYSGCLLAEMSKIIGRDAAELNKYLGKMREAIIAKYNATGKSFSKNSQTENALALDFNIVPEYNEAKVLASLIENCENSRANILTGVTGTKPMYDALSAANQHKLLLDLTISPEKYSFGYMLDNGATSMWEYWEKFGEGPNAGITDPVGMFDSQNHAMLGGGIGTWVFKGLGGITPVKAAYQSINFNPGVESGLSFVNSRINTIIGAVKSNWKNDAEKGKFEWTVEVPANSTGNVVIPFPFVESIVEGTTDIFKRNTDGVKYEGRNSDGYLTYTLGSGTYKFAVSYVDSSEKLPVTFEFETKNETVKGKNDGKITITAEGGSGTYQYSKNGGSDWQDSNVFDALAPGNYSVIVRDKNDLSKVSQAEQVTIKAGETAALSSENTGSNSSGSKDKSTKNPKTGGLGPIFFGGAVLFVSAIILSIISGYKKRKIKT